jgi:hypothetical protein
VGEKPSEDQLNQQEAKYYQWAVTATLEALRDMSPGMDIAINTEGAPPEKRRKAMAKPSDGSDLHGGVCWSHIATLTGPTTLSLRGLNIQYPYSRLIMAGLKTLEARRYALGHRNIARNMEPLFLIETPGARHARDAMVPESLQLPPAPDHAQVVAVLCFSSSTQFATVEEWNGQRTQHRIKEGSPLDWDGGSPMYQWSIHSCRPLCQFLLAGDKTQTGWCTPRTLNVELQ